MASKINADEFVDREGEGKPTLPKGVVLSGVTTITTAVVAENEVANSTGINAGIITSTHFAGNLTGDVNAGIVTVTSQTVIGSAVTISASGIDIGAGVITATSYAGSGANLTGIGATIMIWEYNPDVSDMSVPFATGIGITFNQKIKAGSGNITLREDSSSGTVVENFGIGSSVTISNNSLSLTPTSSLSENQVYYLELPSGVITNMAGDNYVGTAYTFKALGYDYQLWVGGRNQYGNLGDNSVVNKSSPVQVPGTTWNALAVGEYGNMLARKNTGTLWAWGRNSNGELGQNENGDDNDGYSSPVQIGSSTDWGTEVFTPNGWAAAIKTDGTLWAWGTNTGSGQLAQNNRTSYSSPVQIPGTTWSKGAVAGYRMLAIKTDGTLWSWGRGDYGQLGLNNPGPTRYSSPVQIPGTDWATVMCGGGDFSGATKTNGELWMWGKGDEGQLGLNTGDPTRRSSPIQIPGTTWKQLACNESTSAATKTDGTLWTWGNGGNGLLGNNATANRSSPIQIPGTTWDKVNSGGDCFTAVKTDGTLWTWGISDYGQLMQNSRTYYSSPIQIPGTGWTLDNISSGKNNDVFGAIQKV